MVSREKHVRPGHCRRRVQQPTFKLSRVLANVAFGLVVEEARTPRYFFGSGRIFNRCTRCLWNVMEDQLSVEIFKGSNVRQRCFFVPSVFVQY